MQTGINHQSTRAKKLELEIAKLTRKIAFVPPVLGRETLRI
jgi:hypothetical protein